MARQGGHLIESNQRPQRQLQADLARLVQILEHCRDHDRPVAAFEDKLDCWEDDEFLYFEANLPEHDGSRIDINVFCGRVLIRIERELGTNVTAGRNL